MVRCTGDAYAFCKLHSAVNNASFSSLVADAGGVLRAGMRVTRIVPMRLLLDRRTDEAVRQ
jgi:hypothetical protein